MPWDANFIDLNQTDHRSKMAAHSHRNKIRDGNCCRRLPIAGEHDDIRRRLGFRRQEGEEANAGWDSPPWSCSRVLADRRDSESMLRSEAPISAAVPDGIAHISILQCDVLRSEAVGRRHAALDWPLWRSP